METQTATHSAPHQTATSSGRGARLVASDGRSLPLQGTEIVVDAQGGIARTTLHQTFLNRYDEALHVTYALPLPAEGAVSGFSFTRDGRKVVGEIDTKKQARQRFARAIASGRTAAMIEQDRVNQFTQKVGNIPAGATIVCEVEVDQKLIWLPEGAWEWRFPTVVPSRYMGQEGRVSDSQAIDAPLASSPLKARSRLDLIIRDGLSPGGRPSSPSHQLEAHIVGSMCQIAFAEEEQGRLNRDVVIRWPVVNLDVGLQLHVAGPPADSKHDDGDAFGLLTLVPPDAEVDAAPVPRDLIVLLDTSGSMGGRPLQQARELLCAMIRTLQPHDQIELIEFSSAPRRWKREPVEASPMHKKDAIRWLQGLRAGGCTEMRDAILEALEPLRDDAQRQIVLVTDGYIGFENEILAAVHQHLPTSTRLHTIGVGDSVNRALTEPAARAGAGVEIILGLHDAVEPAIHRLLARTEAPLVTDLLLSGDGVTEAAPARLPDLFAGAPVLLSMKLNAQGGIIEVEGSTADGPFSHSVAYPAIAPGYGNQAIAALYGREAINDLEAWRASIDLSDRQSRSQLKDIEASIEDVGLTFQLATRFTSWIAVDQEIAVEPESHAIEEIMPHEAPHGTSVASLGLRAATPAQTPTTTLFGAMAPQRTAYKRVPDIPDSGLNMGFQGLFDKDGDEPTTEDFDQLIDGMMMPLAEPEPEAPEEAAPLFEAADEPWEQAEFADDLDEDSTVLAQQSLREQLYGYIAPAAPEEPALPMERADASEEPEEEEAAFRTPRPLFKDINSRAAASELPPASRQLQPDQEEPEELAQRDIAAEAASIPPRDEWSAEEDLSTGADDDEVDAALHLHYMAPPQAMNGYAPLSDWDQGAQEEPTNMVAAPKEEEAFVTLAAPDFKKASRRRSFVGLGFLIGLLLGLLGWGLYWMLYG